MAAGYWVQFRSRKKTQPFLALLRLMMGSFTKVCVEVPAWRENGRRNPLAAAAIDLLDSGSAGQSGGLRMRHARVFGNFTEEVLAVNRLQPTAEQCLERQARALERALLLIADALNHVFRRQCAGRREAFGDAVERARAGHHE